MNPPIRNSLIALALAALYLPCAFAQSEEDEELALVYGDKNTVSIATGSKQPLRRAPAVATVITAEDIAAMGATDLDQVLETVPGVHVARNSVAYGPIYTIRGVYSTNNPQTLMLQNGVPTTAMFTGGKGNAWGGLPLENISRIEIIRGPGSALYGADAYSGVINIVTKTAAEINGTQVGLRLGSENTQDAWISHGGDLGPFQVAAYLRVGSTDGIRETIDRDATRPVSASLAPGSVNTGNQAIDGNLDLSLEKWRWRFNYKLRDDVGTGAGISQALDPVGQARSERILSDLSWADPQFAKDWGLGATASYMQYNDTVPVPFYLRPAGQAGFPNGMIGAPEKWERQFRLSGYATYTGFADHSLRFGIGHDDLNLYKTRERKNFTATFTPLPAVVDAGPGSIFMLPQRRKVSYLYAQDEWQFAPDWALTAGLRRDIYSDFGATNNPRLALVWDAAYTLTAKLLYGRAFRAPSFAEEYSINNPVAAGNPNLRPETNSTMEAVLNWRPNQQWEFNLSTFHYEMKDIIRIPVGGTAYANTGNQVGTGMELEAVWNVSRNLNLSGHIAHQHSIDETTQQDAGYAPRNHVYGRADWRYSNDWLLSSQVNWVADRKRPPGDSRTPVPDYTTLDVTARTSLKTIGWELAASIRNLLDEKVVEPSLPLSATGVGIPNDLPMARRTFYVQLLYRM
ncbi:MAG: TonB-dependent receptor [Rhodocyclaceae bacterium]|nr:MAG: TonB-dependent receptor [Rhodocyclaceae bacterium]